MFCAAKFYVVCCGILAWGVGILLFGTWETKHLQYTNKSCIRFFLGEISVMIETLLSSLLHILFEHEHLGDEICQFG